MIVAQVIADSISEENKRLITLQLRYPKFIHGEFMTHRVFSRNASSSRAIPVKRLIEDLLRDMALPVFWGSNKQGMQAGDELDGHAREMVEKIWRMGATQAISIAEQLMEWGLHKQIANRVLEPYSCINVVVTATEWSNFFDLRCHPDAQPEMRTLAEAMRDVIERSTPRRLETHAWHLPYVGLEEQEKLFQEGCGVETMVKLSVARCARVSYLTHEGKAPEVDADLQLYERLVGSVPLHASPAEHQATPDFQTLSFTENRVKWLHEELHGNFVGWQQYRKMLERGNGF